MYAHRARPAIVALALGTALALVGTAAPTPTVAQSPTPGAGAFDQSAHDLLPERIRQSGVLKYGTPTDASVYGSKPENEIVGLIPDLANAVGEVLGVEIEAVGMPFPGLIPGIQSGQIDAAWAVLTDTKEREETLDLTSWIRTSTDFLVAEGNPTGLHAIGDLCGKRVGALRAALYIPIIEQQSADCVAAGDQPVDLSQFDDVASALLAVQSDRLDAFIGIAGILRETAATTDGGATFDVAGATLFPAYLGIVTEQGSGLAEALQAALRVVIENGTYDQILISRGAEADSITVDQVQVNGVTSGTLQ